jgi:hypothetical protein
MSAPDTPSLPQVPPGAEDPTSVGNAYMKPDGTLEMTFRTVGRGGMIGEAYKVLKPDDPQYAAMVRHLGGIQPGEGRAIPPFAGPK